LIQRGRRLNDKADGLGSRRRELDVRTYDCLTLGVQACDKNIMIRTKMLKNLQVRFYNYDKL